jgi:hypothetical protein
MKTVFELSAYNVSLDYDSEKDEYIPPQQYPEFDLCECKIGFYSSLANAEAGMQRHAAGLNVRDKKHESIRGTTARYNTLEEYQRAGMFPGRRPEDIRFKEGDIVEVFGEFRIWNKVQLGIVAGTPLTLQERQEWDKPFDEEAFAAGCKWCGDRSDNKYTILTGDGIFNFKEGDDAEDCSDDCYTVVFPNDREKSFPHCRLQGRQIFSPRLRVPKKMKERLEASYRYYKSIKISQCYKKKITFLYADKQRIRRNSARITKKFCRSNNFFITFAPINSVYNY